MKVHAALGRTTQIRRLSFVGLQICFVVQLRTFKSVDTPGLADKLVGTWFAHSEMVVRMYVVGEVGSRPKI